MIISLSSFISSPFRTYITYVPRDGVGNSVFFITIASSNTSVVRGTSSPYRHMFYVYPYMYMIVHDIFLFAYVCNSCITVHSVSIYVLTVLYVYICLYTSRLLYIVFFVAHVKSLHFASHHDTPSGQVQRLGRRNPQVSGTWKWRPWGGMELKGSMATLSYWGEREGSFP